MKHKTILGITIIAIILVVATVGPAESKPNIKKLGTLSTLKSEIHQVTPTTCDLSGPNGIPYGWCPDGSYARFLISDDAVTKFSVISTTTYLPGNSAAAASCNAESVTYVDGANSGFLVSCDRSPAPLTVLNYVIFNSNSDTG